MSDLSFKQIYTFVSLTVTVAWAVFCVWMTWTAIQTTEAADILTSSGSGVLLGAMLMWHGSVVQYFFRKAPPDAGTETEGNPDTPTGTTITTTVADPVMKTIITPPSEPTK